MWNLSIRAWFAALLVLASVALSAWISLAGLQQALHEEKHAQLRTLVDQVVSLVRYHEHQVAQGQLTRDEAQQRVKSLVRAMRYGKDGYFWINDLNHQLIVHPFRPQLEGSSMLDFKDSEGVYVYREFVRVAREPVGEGFLTYHRTRPGFETQSEQLPKLSFVRRVDPWGWVVGTGMFIDDIEVHYQQALSEQLSLWVLLVVLIMNLAVAGVFLQRRRQR